MRTGPVGSVTFQCSSSGAKKHHHFSTVLHLGFDWSLLGLGNLGLLGVLALVFSLSLELSFGSFSLMSLELSFWSFGFVFLVWLIGNAILKAKKPDPNVWVL